MSFFLLWYESFFFEHRIAGSNSKTRFENLFSYGSHFGRISVSKEISQEEIDQLIQFIKMRRKLTIITGAGIRYEESTNKLNEMIVQVCHVDQMRLLMR